LWWHISLKLRPDGLATDNIPLPDGGVMGGRLDLRAHEIVLDASTGWHRTFGLRDGRTGTEMAEAVIGGAQEVGLDGAYVRKDFENDGPREYDESAVPPYWSALNSAYVVFDRHRRTLDHSRVGPIQFWPHGFDLSFEWFGDVKVESEGQSQLNLGFFSAGRPYFYSNPFPYSGAELKKTELSVGAWHEEMYQGSILYYDEIADDPAGSETLARYAREVYEAAHPLLV
jgi:hypothetical protein